jgi:hypothetical protein
MQPASMFHQQQQQQQQRIDAVKCDSSVGVCVESTVDSTDHSQVQESDEGSDDVPTSPSVQIRVVV